MTSAIGFPERAQGFDCLFAFFDVTAVTSCKYQDLPAVPFGRNERQGWCLAHHDPDCKFVGRLIGDAAELGKQLARLFEWMHHKTGQHLRALADAG